MPTPDLPRINLADADGVSRPISTNGTSTMALSIAATSWGDAACVMQWSNDLDNDIWYTSTETFNAATPANLAMYVGAARWVRIAVTAPDGDADIDAAIFAQPLVNSGGSVGPTGPTGPTGATGATGATGTLPAQMVSLVYSTSTESSGNIYLRSGVSLGMGGTAGYFQQGVPWDGSIVAMWASAEVTAYTSGDIGVTVRDITAAEGTESDIFTETITTTKTGDVIQSFTYSSGTNPTVAGRGISVILTPDACTLDDIVVTLFVLLDSAVT